MKGGNDILEYISGDDGSYYMYSIVDKNIKILKENAAPIRYKPIIENLLSKIDENNNYTCEESNISSFIVRIKTNKRTSIPEFSYLFHICMDSNNNLINEKLICSEKIIKTGGKYRRKSRVQKTAKKAKKAKKTARRRRK